MKIYLVYVKIIDSYREDATDKEIVKAFTKRNDAYTFMKTKRNELKTRIKNIREAERHCIKCNEKSENNCLACYTCSWGSEPYWKYVNIEIVNDEDIVVNLNKEKVSFYVKTINVN